MFSSVFIHVCSFVCSCCQKDWVLGGIWSYVDEQQRLIYLRICTSFVKYRVWYNTGSYYRWWLHPHELGRWSTDLLRQSWTSNSAAASAMLTGESVSVYATLSDPCCSSFESLWIDALLASPLPGRLWANITSSTKPEMHNVSQRKIDPQPQITWS